MTSKQLPKDWKEVELGKVIEFIMGQAPPSSSYNEEGKGTLFIRAGDFGKLYPTPSSYTTLPLVIGKEGDVFLCVVGATSGKINLGINGAITRSIFALRPKPAILQKFLYYYLKGEYESLNKSKTGSAQGILNKAGLNNLLIHLPPLPIQKQIVSILEKAEKLKQKREEADKLTKEYLQSVFYEMFGDPIKNEKNFEIKNLNDICDVRDGTHASPKYVDEGYPLITSKNLTNGCINFSQVNFISKEDFDEINKRSKVDVGDIIMPMIGTIGNPIIIPKNLKEFAIKNVALIKFTKTDVSNVYIEFILDSNYFDCITKASNRGGTQKFIALGDIRNIPIPHPPLSLQQKFASIVEQVEKLKEKQKQSKGEINTMFNSLMQKAFNGELIR